MELLVLYDLHTFPESFQVNAGIYLNIMPLVLLFTSCNENLLVAI